MPILTFIRHTQTEANRDGYFAGRIDSSATEEGLVKAKEVFAKKEEKFDVFYVSPLKRTRQTLKAIFPNVDPIEDERITEVYGGDWQGRPKNLVDAALKEKYVKGEYVPPNAEPLEDIKKRLCSFVEEMFEKYDDTTKVLVVSHSALIRNIRRIFLNKYDNIVPKNLEMISINRKEFNEYLEREKGRKK